MPIDLGDKTHMHPTERAARLRAEKFTEFIDGGLNVTDAIKATGVHPNTYANWRAKYPGFSAYVDLARAKHKHDLENIPSDGTVIDFRKRYLRFDTYAHQHRIIEAIEDAPLMGVTLILIPPEFGKSTTLADYCTRAICKDPNIRITVVSEGTGLARKFCGRLRQRFEDNVKFGDMHRKFGPFVPPSDSSRPWQADYFTVAGADHDEQDFTLEARGWRSMIAGTRTDLMLIDDVQSLRSLKLTTDIVDRLRQDFFTRPGQNGKTVMLGTRVGELDVYDALIEAGLVDKLVVISATDPHAPLVECPLGIGCDVPEIPHEQSACPEMWPEHALAKRRKQVGEQTWWRTYQQKPHVNNLSTFTKEDMDGCKNPLRIITRPHLGTGVIGVDPALGGGNAVVTCYLQPNRLEIVDIDRRFNLSKTEEILTVIEAQAMRYSPRLVIVEEMAYQKALRNDDRLEALGAKHGFRVIGHRTGRNKMDEVIGVASMATSFRMKEIDIPWGDDEAKRRFEDMIKEFCAWRPDKKTRDLRQDMVMAFWFVWLYWMEVRKGLSTRDEPKFTLPALPWEPTNYAVGAFR